MSEREAMSERMLSAVSYPPQLDGKHRILAQLGQGGTADVYLAVAQGPSGFNKLVVLKVLKASLQDDPAFAAMFLNEARLTARLNHPNIVQTYEVVEEQGGPMLVMEYLDGQPLSAILRRTENGRLPLNAHLKIIAEMLAGLHYAHELKDFDGTPLGVVHRDASPHNVFVTFDGQVKVLDFGIAKMDVSSVETRTGMLKGKVRYMAPEQIQFKSVDRRVDIYASGVMLWQAAAGEVLWKDLSEPAIIARVLQGKPPSPRSVNPDVHGWLEQICMRAMAEDPNDRYATAAELEAELDALLSELGGPVSTRETGKLVSKMFVDVRQATQLMIERQLSSSGAMTWKSSRPSGMMAIGWTEGSVSQTGRDQAPFVDLAEGPSSARRSRPLSAMLESDQGRRALMVLGASLLTLLAFVLFRATQSDEPPAVVSQAAQPASASAPPLLSAAKPPLLGELRIQATPKEARLFLDGQPLASNPYTGQLPIDLMTHAVRAEAPGYVATAQQFAMKADLQLTFALEREKAAPSAAWRRTAPVVAAPASKPAAPSKAALAPGARSDQSCDKPFYVDQRGIKRIIPECM